MRITLLGTGSADGWPNPWCDCASCRWARVHAPRGQTAVLVDDQLLIDCGPDVPRAAARFGVSLSGLRHLLIGHAHPDHVGPEALMWRSWSSAAREPLDVVGPPAALQVCRDFLRRWEERDPAADGSALRLVTARPGDVIRLGGRPLRRPEHPGLPEDPGYRAGYQTAGYQTAGYQTAGYEVRPVAARHGDERIGPAVLYDVTTPDGGRLLYGCDTAAPLPEETLRALDGRAYDVVLLEENNGDRPGFGEHLDLESFATVVAELRRRRAVVATTKVLAVHLSHRNPPGDELARRLAAIGAEAPPDGTVIDITPGRRDGGAARAETAVRTAGPYRVLFTGGSRSGKSEAAERLLLAEPEVVYVATAAPPDGSDEQWAARIAEHRDRRPPGWTTVETVDLVPLLTTPGPPLLVDSVSLWVAARLDEPDYDDRAARLVAAWRDAARLVVGVTDEVGSGLVPTTASGRRFTDALGRLNARLAAVSDEVWFVVAGIPTRLRPAPPAG